MYLKKKNSSYKLLPFTLVILLAIVFILKTPAFKSNLEQEFRIFQNKKYILTMDKSILSNIENILISFSKNKIVYPKLKIEIPFKGFNKIKNDRNKALRYGLLEDSKKVKGTIELDGKIYNADFRLKGNLPDHWNNTKQWSLKIDIKNNDSLLGLSEFSIVQHRTREYPYSLLVTKNLSRMNVHAPKYSTAEIILNGQEWGLMQIEEAFSNSFLEKRQLKKKPIYKLSNEDDLILGWKYFENGLKGLENHSINENQLNTLSKWLGKFEIKALNAKSNFVTDNNLLSKDPLSLSLLKDQNFIESLLYKANLNQSENFNEIRESFEMQKISDAITSAIIWGEQHYHSIEPHNSRFYLDPFDKLIQIFPNDHAHTFILDVNKENIINQFNRMPNLYRILFFNSNIQKNIKLSIKKFKKNLPFIKVDFKNICDEDKISCKKKIKFICKSYDPNRCREVYYLDEIKDNIKFLEENYLEIFNDKNLEKKSIEITSENIDENWLSIKLKNKLYVFQEFNNLKIINLIPHNIFIDNIEILDKNNISISKKKVNKILYKSSLDKFSEFNINFDNKENNQAYKFKVNFNLQNSKIKLEQNFMRKNYQVEKIKKNFNLNPILNFDGKEYYIEKGEHIIFEPIIIPKGYSLRIDEGTKLRFKNFNYILVKNGSIKLNGTKEKPITLTSSKNTFDDIWNGIYVRSHNYSKSVIKNTNIRNLNFYRTENFFLTGGVNFYNVDLEMNNVNFDNCKSEDCLNITKSRINLNNMSFTNASSDGIDLDFIDGNLKNFDINNIKGDGIDISGSKLILENISVIDVDDKCISIGENSFVDLRNINLENCKYGLVIKDSGKSKVDNIKISNISKFDVAVYKKKTFYDDNLEVKIKNLISKNKFFSQFDTTLEINNEKIQNTNFTTEYINEIF
jgi:uncharacterized protein YjbI with pentapeptide repeats